MVIFYKNIQQQIKSFFDITNNVNNIPDVLKQNYLPSLDGLRALSILMVVGSHVLIGQNIHSALLYSIFNGALGVGIFFVISGFIITTLLMKELIYTKDINLKNFYIRRFLRIIPLAYFFLLVLIVLNYVFKLGVTFSGFLLAFLFLKNFVGSETDPATTHYWSLSVEEQYYLLFPYFFKKSRKLYLVSAIALIFIIIPAVVWLHFHVLSLNQNWLFAYTFMFLYKLPHILIGSVFSILYFKYSNYLKNYSGSIISLLILISIISINSEFAAIARVKAFLFTNIITGILIAVFIGINIFESKSVIYRILNNKGVVVIGKLSYSIYVWQQIFTFIVPWDKSPHKPITAVLFNLIALSVVAYLSYNYFEKPFLKLKQKFQIKKNVTDGQIIQSNI